jgi:hypothetical protein
LGLEPVSEVAWVREGVWGSWGSRSAWTITNVKGVKPLVERR